MPGDWYCLECLSVARFHGPSLDPNHPLVYCLNQSRPCGRTIGARTYAEAKEIHTAAKALAAERRHKAHINDVPVASCSICESVYPASMRR